MFRGPHSFRAGHTANHRVVLTQRTRKWYITNIYPYIYLWVLFLTHPIPCRYAFASQKNSVLIGGKTTTVSFSDTNEADDWFRANETGIVGLQDTAYNKGSTFGPVDVLTKRGTTRWVRSKPHGLVYTDLHMPQFLKLLSILVCSLQLLRQQLHFRRMSPCARPADTRAIQCVICTMFCRPVTGLYHSRAEEVPLEFLKCCPFPTWK